MPDDPLTPAVFHVLLALAEKPLHGYAVMQSVVRTSGGVRVGPGTIYGTLQRLERSGLVRELPSRPGRRREFALTAQGRRTLAGEAKRLARLTRLVRAQGLLTSET